MLSLGCRPAEPTRRVAPPPGPAQPVAPEHPTVPERQPPASMAPSAPETGQPTAHNRAQDTAKRTPAAAIHAEPERVMLRPGASAREKLMGVTPGTPVTIKVDPPGSKVHATLDGSTLNVQAAPDARGTATLHVIVGEATVPVDVTVE